MAASRPLLRRPGVRSLAALLAAAVAAGAPAPAGAETIRLRSGVVYEAESVQLKGESLRLTLRLGAGRGSATFPLERIEPADLVRILRPLTAPDDAAGQLRLARAALEAGLYAEAAESAGRAAALDPALGPAHAAVHEGIRAAHADAALAEIEGDLRGRRPLAARERARALLESGVPVVPPQAQAQRARLLLSLAEGLAAAKPALPAPAPPQPAAPVAPEALPPALADVDPLVERGLAAREQAADPGLPAPLREARLLAAGEDLLHARRLLQALPATADVVARLDALRAFLVATWLDLADLARAAGEPLVALDRVQAALVLEPENERAWDLRRWIEGDLSGPPVLIQEPALWFSPGFLSSSFYGSSYGSHYGGGAGCCPGPYAGGYRLHGHGHGHGHAHAGHHPAPRGNGSSGGARHNPGRRR